ncbi:MAG: response regulator transcription factor [Clostridia bacterium]|nr:response regulator transcription factor [Clostridia bacterium]
MQKPLILCVDDEPNILDLLTFNLEMSGYETISSHYGRDAISLAADAVPALIILDLGLPDASGLDVLKALRASPVTIDIPVIVLTASDSEVDTVLAFELGADDYVKKPFGVRELLARVKAVLRRSGDVSASDIIRVGPLTIDSGNYEVFRKDSKLSLTLKEYELLKLLASTPGKVLTRDFLLDRIWGYEFYGETRTVDVHIRHIRAKLGDDANMIETVRGVGYKMKATA